MTALPPALMPNVAGSPAPKASFAESLAGADSAADAERLRGLRRMKVVALSFLVGATVIFLLCTWAQSNGAAAWVGYVRAAAEAGMVGALADWFAVTALFKHPLGIPIPHTAIIKKKKDAARRGPRHLRPGELHVAGGGRNQTARCGGRGPPRQMAVGTGARPTGRGRGLHGATGFGGNAARRGRTARAGQDDRQTHRRATMGAADRPGAGHAAGGASSGSVASAARRPGIPVVTQRRRHHRARGRAGLAHAGHRAGWTTSSATVSTAS